MVDLFEWIASWTGGAPVWLGLAGGLVLALFNTSGAALALVWRDPSERLLDSALGFAAGVMLTASFTSLILPGVEHGGLLPVLAGIVLGAAVVFLGDRYVPHRHFVKGREGPASARVRGVWLFILAITLHNMPEGLAVGVRFGSGDLREAVTLMTAIGIQNVPEGLAVAVSATSAGLGARRAAALMGVRAGLVEVPVATLGAWLVGLLSVLLPYAMGFAAGAMLYVVSHEIVPETHRKGHEHAATAGLIVGVVVMLYLDLSLSLG
jgi:ZIP family zinc transporter